VHIAELEGGFDTNYSIWILMVDIGDFFKRLIICLI
jgi:hypothetical protein